MFAIQPLWHNTSNKEKVYIHLGFFKWSGLDRLLGLTLVYFFFKEFKSTTEEGGSGVRSHLILKP